MAIGGDGGGAYEALGAVRIMIQNNNEIGIVKILILDRPMLTGHLCFTPEIVMYSFENEMSQGMK